MKLENNKKARGKAIAYKYIESLLKNKILSGHYLLGEKLPKEEKLAEKFGVSKITIRSALSGLEQEGLIVRIRGSGTFITDKLPLKKQIFLTGGVDDIVLDSTRYKVKAIDIKQTAIKETRFPYKIGGFFDCSKDRTLTTVRRMRFIDACPVYYIENYIGNDVAKSLTIKNISEMPILEILKEKNDLVIGKGEMHIDTLHAEPDIAELLSIKTFDHLIMLTLKYWFPNGSPIELVNYFIKAEYFKYSVKLTGLNF